MDSTQETELQSLNENGCIIGMTRTMSMEAKYFTAGAKVIKRGDTYIFEDNQGKRKGYLSVVIVTGKELTINQHI